MGTIIKDPAHPDFPHGTIVGGRRKCPCTPCHTAKLREDKRLSLIRQRGVSSRYAPPEVTARVIAHVKRLMETPGFSGRAIGESVGLSHSTAGAVIQTGRVSPRAAKALLSATPSGVAKHTRWAPLSEVMFLIRTMQALGYPVAWQERRIGHVGYLRLLVDREGEQKHVDASIAAKIKDLSREVGDRPATPGPDLPSSSINYALAMAKRHGFYPPACYNEDGTLDYRAIPNHPWSRADEEAHRRIALLRALLKHDGVDKSREQVGAELGCTKRTVERVVAHHHLKLTNPERPGIVKDLTTLLDQFDADLIDPVLFALTNGLADPYIFPSDHPGFIEWWAQNPEWERQSTKAARLRREQRDADATMADAA